MLETVKNQLFAISFAGLLFLACTFGIILFADPFNSSAVTIALLYVSVIGFSLNFFALLIYGVRRKFSDGLHYKKISIALREAVLLTILVVGLLFLSSHNLFYWWIVGTFLLALMFIEGFFLI